ncbi:MAG TPA: amidohydrolase family protein [Candidatus Limnocylindrales bacterium]|nr:amidohydrolase family protein [Candidatus Limnocylindrales bacterium]
MTDRVVDVHVHAVPPALDERIEAGWSPHVSSTRLPDGRRQYRFPSMDPSPPAPAALHDLAAMTNWADEHEITTQLIGPWTDLLGYTLPAAVAESWSQLYNEALATACDGSAHTEPMGTIPLQDPGAAVRVLEAAKRMGCVGLVIGTDLPGTDLADPALDDVWAAAAEQRLPILVHPTFLSIPVELQRNGLKNAMGRASVTALALTQAIYAGVLERHPGLVLIAAHGGGAFVPQIDRIVRNQELGWSGTDVDLAASVRRIYWDSVVVDPSYLGYLAAKVGADRVVLGSDHPFPWEAHPVRMVGAAHLDPEQTSAIVSGTAASIFDLPDTGP